MPFLPLQAHTLPTPTPPVACPPCLTPTTHTLPSTHHPPHCYMPAWLRTSLFTCQATPVHSLFPPAFVPHLGHTTPSPASAHTPLTNTAFLAPALPKPSLCLPSATTSPCLPHPRHTPSPPPPGCLLDHSPPHAAFWGGDARGHLNTSSTRKGWRRRLPARGRPSRNLRPPCLWTDIRCLLWCLSEERKEEGRKNRDRHFMSTRGTCLPHTSIARILPSFNMGFTADGMCATRCSARAAAKQTARGRGCKTPGAAGAAPRVYAPCTRAGTSRSALSHWRCTSRRLSFFLLPTACSAHSTTFAPRRGNSYALTPGRAPHLLSLTCLPEHRRCLVWRRHATPPRWAPQAT